MKFIVNLLYFIWVKILKLIAFLKVCYKLY